jgi:membrane protein insertase Oxa1/YidC/SpoIIIJ
MPPAPKKKEKSEEGSREPEFQDILSGQMLYMMPIMAFVFALGFPAGLPFYWSISTAVSILQQYFIKKTVGGKK